MSWKYWDESGEHDWTNADDPLPDGADLFRREFLLQFDIAISERMYLLAPLRMAALGAAAQSVVGITSDPQSFAAWNGLWNCLWQMTNSPYYGFFNTSPPSVVDLSALDITPDTIGTVTWTSSSIGEAVGIGEGSGVFMPRQRNGESIESPFEFRAMAHGDIVGPWCFEDLRRVISRIRCGWAEMLSGAAYLSKDVPQAEYKEFPYDRHNSHADDYADFLDKWHNRALSLWKDQVIYRILSQRAWTATETVQAGMWKNNVVHVRHVWKYTQPTVASNVYTFTWSLFYFPIIPNQVPINSAVPNIRDPQYTFNAYELDDAVENQYRCINSGSDRGQQYYDSSGYYGEYVETPPLAGAYTILGALHHVGVESRESSGMLVMTTDFVYE